MNALSTSLVALLVAGFAAAVPPGNDAAKAPAPLAKVVVVGASVSAGVGLDPAADPFQGQESKVRLGSVIDASVVGAHELVDLSSMMYFTAPEPTAKRSAKDAAGAKPTLVVALDYLFWLGYGPGDEKARLERLETGLEALQSFTCPVLLGDFADFDGVKVSRMMLAPESIPNHATVAKLNARLADFAKAHANVVLVPIGEMFRKLNADEPIEIHGNRFEKGARAQMMQADGLHTTLKGTAALWVLAVDAWLSKAPAGVDEKTFVLDVAQLVERAPAASGGTASAKPKPGKPVSKGKAKEKAGAAVGG